MTVFSKVHPFLVDSSQSPFVDTKAFNYIKALSDYFCVSKANKGLIKDFLQENQPLL
ncbi:hypothetical protein SH2C18_47730 [Clostridium sediminicola]